MMPWERWAHELDDSSPIYKQLIAKITGAFACGQLAPGSRLPSVREAAALLRVNTNTIQRVYQTMERDGIITCRRGTGYYLSESEDLREGARRALANAALGRFRAEMRALGYGGENMARLLGDYLSKGDEDDAKHA
ncbi:MAG: GntR family transcriptional regulator [Oscillospiraceae bacterium]|jgi:DNA-binding transcriptional regulator YhcF (GntR family)|nr:GntR family transcriptional regulator [Oscillospiraceae bacterium]